MPGTTPSSEKGSWPPPTSIDKGPRRLYYSGSTPGTPKSSQTSTTPTVPVSGVRCPGCGSFPPSAICYSRGPPNFPRTGGSPANHAIGVITPPALVVYRGPRSLPQSHRRWEPGRLGAAPAPRLDPMYDSIS